MQNQIAEITTGPASFASPRADPTIEKTADHKKAFA
jgi:hypothetical protein